MSRYSPHRLSDAEEIVGRLEVEAYGFLRESEVGWIDLLVELHCPAATGPRSASKNRRSIGSNWGSNSSTWMFCSDSNFLVNENDSSLWPCTLGVIQTLLGPGMDMKINLDSRSCSHNKNFGEMMAGNNGFQTLALYLNCTVWFQPQHYNGEDSLKHFRILHLTNPFMDRNAFEV